MPTMSGWEFLDALNSLNVKVSIFMLTSSIDPRDQEKAASYEMVQDFISKPLREDRLKMIIN
jgi:CheY-like chemotaxis protein